MSWAPGTIVVCVDARPGTTRRGRDGKILVDKVVGAPLVKGSHFTIRKVVGPRAFHDGNDIGVLLNENVRFKATNDGIDIPWAASRFRLAESSHSESATAYQKAPTNA